MATKSEWMWAIGLFEGEGSIGIRGNWREAGGLQLSSSDEDVVRRFASIVACGHVRGPYQYNPKHKPMWRWAASKRTDVQKLLNRMYPHLGERRKQKALEILIHINAESPWRE